MFLPYLTLIPMVIQFLQNVFLLFGMNCDLFLKGGYYVLGQRNYVRKVFTNTMVKSSVVEMKCSIIL